MKIVCVGRLKRKIKYAKPYVQMLGWKARPGFPKCRNTVGWKRARQRCLETIQASLLLLFADGIHALLQMGSGNFSVPSLLSFFLDLQHAPSIFLVCACVLFSIPSFLEIKLKFASAFSPCITIRFDLVALSLQIRKCLFQGCCQLLLSEQMFLDCANPGLLVFLDLRDGKVLAAGPVA